MTSHFFVYINLSIKSCLDYKTKHRLASALNFAFIQKECISFIAVTENANINYQLIFNPTEMSWLGASTWCEIKGGELVTVDSQSVVSTIEWYKDNDWSAHWYYGIEIVEK